MLSQLQSIKVPFLTLTPPIVMSSVALLVKELMIELIILDVSLITQST
jgi:hypothetical protein